MVTNTTDASGTCPVGGPCSLRQAINSANSHVNSPVGVPDEIHFNVSGAGCAAVDFDPTPSTNFATVCTIKPLSALPNIIEPLIMDGYTQVAAEPKTAPRMNGTNPGVENEIPAILTIEIDGSNLTTGNGLFVNTNASTIKGLVINGYKSSLGLIVLAGGNNIVQGNYVGTDPTGTIGKAALMDRGIEIRGSDNIVGGLLPAERNLASGIGTFPHPTARGRGIQTRAFAPPGINAKRTSILGNLVGTAARLDLPAIGNQDLGITLFAGSSDSLIEGNVITKTRRDGISLVPSGVPNFCPANPNESLKGVIVKNNITYENNLSGISIRGNHCGVPPSIPSERMVIENNTIYSNPYGIAIYPFGPGSIQQTFSDGIDLLHNTIKGTGGNILGQIGLFIVDTQDVKVDNMNFISDLNLYGVVLSHGSSNVKILNNVIKNNGRDGAVVGTIQDNLISLTPNSSVTNVTFANNQIYGNVETGVVVGSDLFDDGVPGDAYDISILENAIHSNGKLGIDLTKDKIESAHFIPEFTPALIYPYPDGVTTNDPLDSDEGANHFQNFPELIWAKSWQGVVRVHGQLFSEPFKTYRIEFFANKPSFVDLTGFGEGQCFLGFTEVNTNDEGHSMIDTKDKFSIPFETGQCNVMLGDYVTATATEMIPNDPVGLKSGSTSEFSQAVLVTP